MNTRTLGKSGIEVTTIGLGTNYVGGHNLYENVDEEEGVRLVQRALDEGVTHLDTADAYGFGRSEELTGKAIPAGVMKSFSRPKEVTGLENTVPAQTTHLPICVQRLSDHLSV